MVRKREILAYSLLSHSVSAPALVLADQTAHMWHSFMSFASAFCSSNFFRMSAAFSVNRFGSYFLLYLECPEFSGRFLSLLAYSPYTCPGGQIGSPGGCGLPKQVLKRWLVASRQVFQVTVSRPAMSLVTLQLGLLQ